MRVASFSARLELTGVELVSLDAPAPIGIAQALERAEAALADAGAESAVIAGAGDWELAAALACAKALVPYAYLADPGAPAPHSAHLERLAEIVIAPEAPEAAVQAWLAAPGA